MVKKINHLVHKRQSLFVYYAFCKKSQVMNMFMNTSCKIHITLPTNCSSVSVLLTDCTKNSQSVETSYTSCALVIFVLFFFFCAHCRCIWWIPILYSTYKRSHRFQPISGCLQPFNKCEKQTLPEVLFIYSYYSYSKRYGTNPGFSNRPTFNLLWEHCSTFQRL